MGFFDKFKKKKEDAEIERVVKEINAKSSSEPDRFGPEDPYGRPTSWFFGDEGKRAMAHYMDVYNDSFKYEQVERLMESDDFMAPHDLHGIMVLKRKNCYLSYIFCYLESLRSGHLWNYEIKGTCWFVYYLANAVFKRLNKGESLEDVLSQENNPFIKFFVKFDFPETPSRFLGELYKQELRDRNNNYIIIVSPYIAKAFDDGVNVSDESWLYETSTFMNKNKDSLYSAGDFAYIMKIKARHREYLPNGTDALAAKSKNRHWIEEELF